MPSSPGPARVPLAPSRSRYELALEAPFRLDLTASALRRLPTNPVDVITSDRRFLHAFAGSRGPLIARVWQPRPEALAVSIEGAADGAGEHERVLGMVRRTLGIDRDVRPFARAAGAFAWLGPLAHRMLGLKPPRYRSLWEAFVNAIVFQQVSLHAASAVVRRLVLAFGTPLESDGTRLHLFPGAERVLSETDGALRATGLSAHKVAALRRAGDAIASGAIGEAMLEERSSVEAATLLRRIKGIGPWTAAVILLRGLGRLDVFPMNDSGVARSLALVAGSEPVDVPRVLRTLDPQRGMLYYHLLLARLEARGEIGSPSVPPD